MESLRFQVPHNKRLEASRSKHQMTKTLPKRKAPIFQRETAKKS